ncbi:MAG TPA: DMT family transporter [Terriglobales bacterium]|nr:DMT family transporter [Terriglobales bacterium]
MKQAELAKQKRRIWWAAPALAVASICWGVAVPLSKKAVTALPPVTLISLQLLVSIIVLWGALLVFRRPAAIDHRGPISRSDLYKACFSGVLQPGATFLLVTIGLLLTSASEVVLLDASEPILIIILAALLLKERISLFQLICACAALGGAVLVILPQIDGLALSWHGLIGDLLVMAGLCVAAFYVIMSRRLISAYDGLHLAAIQQSAAFVFAIAVLVLATLFGLQPLGISVITPEVAGIVALSGILQFALPFWLYLRALEHMRASITALFLPLIPLSGVIVAYVMLGERLDIGQAVGAALIVLAVLAATMGGKTAH